MNRHAPTRIRPAARRRDAFTLLEMLVAVALTVLLLTIVGLILDPIRKTVTIVTAQLELSNFASAVENALRDDFRRLDRDAFIVVKTQVANFDEDGDAVIQTWERHNIDQLLFFANGPWTSQRYQLWTDEGADTGMSRTFRASSARIWYGHLGRYNLNGCDPDWAGLSPVQPPTIWPLGRHALLISAKWPVESVGGGPSHIVGADSIWCANTNVFLPAGSVPPGYPAYTPTPFAVTWDGIMQGQCDTTCNTSMADIRTTVMTGATAPRGFVALGLPNPQAALDTAWVGTQDAPGRQYRMAAACFRPYGESVLDYSSAVDRAKGMYTHATIAPNCSDYKVEFAGDFDTVTGMDVDGAGNLLWYGGLDSSALRIRTGNANIDRFENGDNSATAYGKYTATFGYSRTETPWPRLVRVTMRLHDQQGKLHDMHLNSGGPTNPANATQDGRLFQFVLEVPSR